MSLPAALPGILAGLLATGGLAVALSWAYARMWCRPRRKVAAATPADLGLAFDAVAFPSGGVWLRGWLLRPATPSSRSPAVVLAHGWSGCAADVLPVAASLVRAGFAVLAYDARGHGRSGAAGPVTILDLAGDVLAAAEHLRARPGVDGARLGVVGQSIGGGAAILAASADPGIRAVATCAAFSDPEALTRATMARQGIPARPFAWLVVRLVERWLGARMADVAPRSRIGRTGARLLLLHGGADRFIPAADLEALFARAPRGRAERLLLPGVGHSGLLRDARAQEAIAAFFARALSGENPPPSFDEALDRAFDPLPRGPRRERDSGARSKDARRRDPASLAFPPAPRADVLRKAQRP